MKKGQSFGGAQKWDGRLAARRGSYLRRSFSVLWLAETRVAICKNRY